MKRDEAGLTSGEDVGLGGNSRLRWWILLLPLLVPILAGVWPEPLHPLNTAVYDHLLKVYPNGRPADRLLIVHLDERSLERYGHWPWPRHRVAELCERIAEAKPAVIGLDMFFAEAGDNDRTLATALAKGPFILGNQFLFGPTSVRSTDPVGLRPLRVATLKSSKSGNLHAGLPEATGVLGNLPALAEKAGGNGFLNFSPDPGGMLRRLPLLIRFRGETYPSLALAMALHLAETDQLLLREEGGVLRSISFRGTTVPVDRHGQVLIRFRGPFPTYDSVSAADLLERRVSPSRLRNRVVLVGTTAVGLESSLTTPYGPGLPGVEAHATLVDNLLTGDFLTIPAWASLVTLLLALLFGGATAWTVVHRGMLRGLAMASVLAVGMLLATGQAFARAGWFVGPALPMASVIACFVVLTVVRYRYAQHQAAAAVKKGEVRYRLLADVSPVGIFRTDPEGRTVYVNPMWCRISGMSSSAALGDGWLEGVHPDDRERVIQGWQEASKKRQGSDTDYRFLRPDGRIAWVMGQATPEKDEKGQITGYIGTITDITERKESELERERLKDRLHQSEKLEAVGALAGGVAHDFNNMLGAIIGFSELTLNRMDPKDPHRQNLERILEAAQKSANLTRQLLAFARKQPIQPEVFDLNGAIESMQKMIGRLVGENIELTWRPAPAPLMVRMDPTQVDQILVNLCVNARDAITGVGRIFIETTMASSEETFNAISRGGLETSSYVRLSVQDTGVGMDKQTLDRIFEPFFSTKHSGKGTGLGLATVYGIVKQNHGYIDVVSELGRGSTFHVFLPLVEGTDRSEAETQAEGTPACGGETILLVEDEPALLAMGRTVLEGAGYTVLSAASPSEALRIASEFEREIHLLVTDVIMPEMNGRLLAQRLWQIRPEMQCLFMSGYTEEIVSQEGVIHEGVSFIKKPFSLQEFAATVRETLDRKPQPRGRDGGRLSWNGSLHPDNPPPGRDQPQEVQPGRVQAPFQRGIVLPGKRDGRRGFWSAAFKAARLKKSKGGKEREPGGGRTRSR